MRHSVYPASQCAPQAIAVAASCSSRTIPSSKLDGCAFFDGETPVVGLSGRGKRIDKVFFTLLHEVAHILLGHVGTAPIVDEVNPDHAPDADIDEAANELAARWLFGDGLPAAPAGVSEAWIPQAVDAQERSEAIIDATITVLAEGGFAKLTLSNLAKELGGSNAVLAEIATIDPRQRTGHVLRCFLLDDEQDVREKKVSSLCLLTAAPSQHPEFLMRSTRSCGAWSERA
ncbi:hypothetical protein [Microbacterium sp. W4I20]|uniref:hypothetical protein n=1 Tax=Microbacterium sp. W4I20 TaxID=3042262 RepID=UPI0027811E38|nr:hypothetical protein [Microbacterium sp. W4I20]MDQ0728812.1 hypothetical protein [Microbacterium sp. W4I20]